jgi:hypothetical protein
MTTFTEVFCHCDNDTFKFDIVNNVTCGGCGKQVLPTNFKHRKGFDDFVASILQGGLVSFKSCNLHPNFASESQFNNVMTRRVAGSSIPYETLIYQIKKHEDKSDLSVCVCGHNAFEYSKDGGVVCAQCKRRVKHESLKGRIGYEAFITAICLGQVVHFETLYPNEDYQNLSFTFAYENHNRLFNDNLEVGFHLADKIERAYEESMYDFSIGDI